MQSIDEQRVAFLKCIPLFAKIIDEKLIAKIAGKLNRTEYKEGDVLCNEGEPQPAIFLLEEGKINRIKGEAIVDTLEKGDISGMLHVFEKSPTFASLVCAEKSLVWSILANDFEELLNNDPTFMRELIIFLSRELRSSSKHLRAMGHGGGDKKFSIIFFDSKPYEEEAFKAANEQMGNKLRLEFVKPRLDENSVRLAAGYNCVCIFVNDNAQTRVIEQLGEMKVSLLAMRCAGYNNVDLAACDAQGITVVRVPAYSPYAVAEHAVALMLTLNRQTHRAFNRTKEGNFSLTGLMGFDMHSKVVGVIGTGKIGKCVVEILVGFGCQVLCFDKYQDESIKHMRNTRYVDNLDELLTQARVITLHAPLLDSTRHMINEETIGKMQDGVMIINTSRGGLIDSHALINGLKSRKIGFAGLDVIEEESDYFFEDHSGKVISNNVIARLMTFPNVIITGHQAFFTIEAMTTIANTTIDNVLKYHVDKKKGKEHPNFVQQEYK